MVVLPFNDLLCQMYVVVFFIMIIMPLKGQF